MAFKIDNIPQLSFSLKQTLSPRSLITLILLVVICIRAHEYAHVLAAVVQGVSFQFRFFEITTSASYPFISIAGPLLTYTLMWVGLMLLLKSRNMKRAGFELIFAGGPLFRMTGRMLATIPGRDELAFCRAFHIPDPIAVAIVWGIVLPPLIYAYFVIDSKNRNLWFLFFFVAILMLGALIVLSGDYFLLPVLTRGPFADTMLGSSFHGFPLVVVLFDAAVITIYLFIRRLTILKRRKSSRSAIT